MHIELETRAMVAVLADTGMRISELLGQILKFSRKTNKFIHDDFPDALMKADTKMKGKSKNIVWR